MSHNSRIRGPSDPWLNILPGEYQAFDLNLASGVNGDDGSCHSPSTQISIRGAGLQVTGPLRIARGGQAQSATAGAFQLNDSDYPQLSATHVGRTRKVVYPVASGSPLQGKAGWFCRWTDGAMQSMAPMLDMSNGLGFQPARIMVPIRAHDGSTLSSASIAFRIGWPHQTLPSVFPMARVIRVNASGQPVPLTSAAAGGDPNGFVQAAKPATVSGWSGQQTITVPCDQNNVVSISQYAYYVEIVEEQGLQGYPWQLVIKQPVDALLRNNGLAGSTTLTGILVVDGVSLLVDGSRILVCGGSGLLSSTPTLDGIWTMHGGAWSRAPDCRVPSDFTQGMIVPVKQGTNSGGTYFQAKTTNPPWTAGTQPNGVQPWSASIGYTLGVQVVPVTNPTGFWYQCTGAGTSSLVEPTTWPTAVGASFTDGSVTWTCEGPASTPIDFVTRGIDDAETPQNIGNAMYPKGNVYQAVIATYSNITQAGFE